MSLFPIRIAPFKRKNRRKIENEKLKLQIKNLEQDFFSFMLLNSEAVAEESKAQLKQDLAALIVNRFKRGGFFVEFGATNGVDLSNTYVLEKHFGWNGILAEPGRTWHTDLLRNRSCHIDTNCVWKASGHQLEFDLVEEAELSTISTFSENDKHSENRLQMQKETVETISLTDLLKKYNAPSEIDYLSVDTEGSEHAILSVFDFNAYRFNFITVEHNFAPQRDRLHDLFCQHGYRRVLTTLSKWDDWYVPEDWQAIHALEQKTFAIS